MKPLNGDDLIYFRAWPEGKEAIHLGTHEGRFLVSINSSTRKVMFDKVTDNEWKVLAEGLAQTVLQYQTLCNQYVDSLDKGK